MASVQAAPARAKVPKTIYLIRHGEKPQDDDEVAAEKPFQDADGVTWSPTNPDDLHKLTMNTLNLDGLKRRDELATIFGPTPGKDPEGKDRVFYNIGYIIAQRYENTQVAGGSQSRRPQQTVDLLAKRLKLPLSSFVTDIETDEFGKVADAATGWAGEGDVLICWEHCRLINIAQALQVLDPPPYPDDRYDLIWTIPQDKPYQDANRELKSIVSEKTKAEHVAGNITNFWSPFSGGIGWQEQDHDKQVIRTLQYQEKVAAFTTPTKQSIVTSQWAEQILDDNGEMKDKEFWWRDETKDADVTVQWGRSRHSKGHGWEQKQPGNDD